MGQQKGFSMPRRPAEGKLLPPNAKALNKAIKPQRTPRWRKNFAIEGQRGLVLLVTAGGTATWYFHYDVVEGKKRTRRKDIELVVSTKFALRSALESGGFEAGD